jgi:transglutaminase-like putative cysteine protease
MTSVLSDAVRGLESNFIWLMIFWGTLFGVFFARSNLSGRIVGMLGVIAGLEVAVLRIGRFGGPIREVLTRFFEWLPQIYYWLYESAQPPNTIPLLESMIQTGERLETLIFRITDWLYNFIQGQPIYDPVVVTFLWGFAIWGAVVWSMWSYIRYKNTLLGLLPGTLLVATSLAFVRQSSHYLTMMFGTICALIVITNFDFHENNWKITKMRYSVDIQPKIVMASVGLAIGLMLIAAFIPAISIERITDVFQRLAGETREGVFASSLGLEPRRETPIPSVLEAKRRGGLPNAHLIGSGPELSEQVIMVARLETSLGNNLESDQITRPTYYFRSLTYDGYTGRGWISRRTQEREYSPGDLLFDPVREDTYQVRQQIQFVEEGDGIVYTVGEPLSIDQDFLAAWRILDDQSGIYDLFGVMVAEDIYRADSLVRIYSEEELRAAGQDYPAWLQERYLQLPGSLPERIYALARDLTATEPNPYDRAVALESYLRTIPYTLDVDTGPGNQDIVDYFLFDLEKGYCDYYASAMVVLARAAGLPARYVIGYLAETFDETDQVYIITADQAHAWTEVYFPGYGWIPFEPTGGRGAIDRLPEPSAELPEDFELDLSPLVDESPSVFRNWPFMVGIGITLIFLLIFIGWISSDVVLYFTPTGVLPEKIFGRLYKISGRIGIRLQPGETAYEFTRKLNGYLDILSKGSRWSAWMRMTKTSIDRLTGVFVGYLFRTSADDQFDKKELIRAYKNIRRLMWYLWILIKLFRLKWLRPMLGSNVQQFAGAVNEDMDRTKRKQKSGQIALS